MILPQQFAIANGLTHKKCALIVRDERQRSWNLKLSSSNSRTRVYIGDGWRKFAEENFLKEGDRLMFEIVTNGETPIWKFRVVTHGETPMKKSQDEDEDEYEDKDETTYDKSFGQPHFECIIRQYCLSKGFMVSLKITI
ncbi:hypothetical protein AABB24_003671 [Solanum stoloniferum]|uniref:TF-B3 domain-containing protein n=1 Tax=Solanum stoloniferum TaxID=62892 RepID=A0ABD2VB74_9SOLN